MKLNIQYYSSEKTSDNLLGIPVTSFGKKEIKLIDLNNEKIYRIIEEQARDYLIEHALDKARGNYKLKNIVKVKQKVMLDKRGNGKWQLEIILTGIALYKEI